MTPYRKTNNTVDQWIQDVSQGKSHILPDLERDLIIVYQDPPDQGAQDTALRELLAYNASSLASIVLGVYHSARGAKNIEVVDLLQEAVAVFVKKLDTFDLGKGVRLITYYTRDVRTMAQRYIAAHAMNVRQGSVYLQGIAAKVSEARRDAESSTGQRAGLAEVANRLGISERTLAMVDEFTSITVTPIDERLGYDSGIDDYDSDDDDYTSDARSSKGVYLLFEVLTKKLGAKISEEESKQVLISLSLGEDIPLALLKRIKENHGPNAFQDQTS